MRRRKFRTQRQRSLGVVGLGVVLCLAPHPPADAAASTGNESIFANVVSACIVSNATLNFGTYTATAASTSTTTIAVTCNYGAVVTVALDNGLDPGKASAYGTRALANNGHYLGYDIYSNAAHTTVWNQSNTRQFTSTGSTENLTAYGMIRAGQTTAYAGTYTDTVNITVTF